MQRPPEKLIPDSPIPSPMCGTLSPPITPTQLSQPHHTDHLAEINSTLAKIADILRILDTRVGNLETQVRVIADVQQQLLLQQQQQQQQQTQQQGGRGSEPLRTRTADDLSGSEGAQASSSVSSVSSAQRIVLPTVGISESPNVSPSIPVPMPNAQREFPSLLESPHEQQMPPVISPPPGTLDPGPRTPRRVSPSPTPGGSTPQEPFWTTVFAAERRQMLLHHPLAQPPPYPAAGYATTAVGNLQGMQGMHKMPH